MTAKEKVEFIGNSEVILYQDLGQYDKAVKYYEKNIAIAQESKRT